MRAIRPASAGQKLSAVGAGARRDSATTGSTSCVIWSVKHLGEFEKEEALFTTARLEDHKGQASCFSINIEATKAEEGVPPA